MYHCTYVYKAVAKHKEKTSTIHNNMHYI